MVKPSPSSHKSRSVVCCLHSVGIYLRLRLSQSGDRVALGCVKMGKPLDLSVNNI